MTYSNVSAEEAKTGGNKKKKKGRLSTFNILLSM